VAVRRRTGARDADRENRRFDAIAALARRSLPGVPMLNGVVFDRFHVDTLLRTGGMGAVWLARDAHEDARDVLLKTVRPDLVDDDEVRAAFRKEIDVTSRLSHDRVVRCVAHGEHQGVDVLALHKVPGRSLDEPESPMSVAAALTVGIDVAEALAHVHALACDDGAPLGVVHGDVSPNNIIVDDAGRATLIDFGAAMTAGAEPGEIYAGKPGYVSPEQSRGDVLDQQSDQYSLGVVLWELIAGRSLFEHDARRRGREIPHLAAAPGAVDDVVMRMLSFDKSERYPSCALAAHALRRARASAPSWSPASATLG
jgi:serine/threonine protein kinase